MSTVARSEADEIPLIEEQIDTGLAELMAGYRSGFTPGGERDALGKRFVLYPSRPLPQFDHAYGNGFEAADTAGNDRSVYAMVLANDVAYRHLALTNLAGFTHPNLATLLGAGPVLCSHLNESRFVIFLERPDGVRLSEAMKNTPRLHEHKVIDHILAPAVKALLAMRERKTSHGNICPANFFIGETSVLGDCYSMPCGTLAHPIYQPLELLMTDPLGRGEANEKTDVYALGILALELTQGMDRLKSVPRENFIRLCLEQGSYNLFTGGREMSDSFTDFFRGVLNDNPSERWGLEQLAQWLSGKRFNMIAPAAPKETTRPISFAGGNYFGGRLLANAFRRQWSDAVNDVKALRLDRWCEMSLHRPEMSERVERALRIAGEASTEKHVSDMMTRVIAIFDPIGPIRTRSLALRPDGIGPLLAWLVREDLQSELDELLNVIDTDVANYWADLSEFAKAAPENSQMLWRLQRVRQYLKSRSFGFGFERALYDLNPSLPCQSALLKQYHVTTASDALRTLDALSRNLAPETSFLDRHLAAFVAGKIEIGKEIRLHELATLPALAKNGELVVMRILAKAQQRDDKLLLPGLVTWAAMRIERMLDEIHNRPMRRKLKLQLKKLAASGSLSALLGVVINRGVATQDYEGFVHAIALHQINHGQIERFQNPRLVQYHANDLGGKIATAISYFVLGITSYVTLTTVMGI